MSKNIDASRVIEQIAQHQESIASERDRLDDFIDDLKGLRESCRDALEDLESARDALSRLA